MTTYDDCRVSYTFNSTIGNFTFNGTCVYCDGKLSEANGTAFIPSVNPETQEEELNDIGTFNYNFYLEDRVNYSFYIQDTLAGEYFTAILSLIAELKERENNSQ